MKNALTTIAALALLSAGFGWVAFGEKLGGAPKHGEDWCEPHQVELSRCETCNPKLRRGGTMTSMVREAKSGECPNTLVRITLGPGAAESAGLQTVEIATRPVDERIRANAETRFVPSAFARVAPRLAGTIGEVQAALGQDVAAGAPLATVECPELAAAKSAYLQAVSLRELRQKSYDNVAALFEKRLVTGKDEMEARSALEEAKIEAGRAATHLKALGMTDNVLAEVAASRDLSATIVVRAPFAGTVVAATAVAGESAAPDRPIFSVANTEKMWAGIDLPETDLTRVAKGQKVAFTVDGIDGKRFTGKIVAIGSEVDERTRTAQAFAEIKNPDGLLKAQMFGKAEITVKDPQPRLLVPKAALQNDGDCNLVFVRVAKDVFQARKVEVGATFEGGFEIVGGVVAGETVASTGAFLLKTEAMKNQMGAS